MLFKPVLAMKVRTEYRDGLVIRCADQEEAAHIYAESGDVEPGAGAHCLILETGNDRDYVVAHANPTTDPGRPLFGRCSGAVYGVERIAPFPSFMPAAKIRVLPGTRVMARASK